MTSPRAQVTGGVLCITLPGTPLDAPLATAVHALLTAPDDLEAPAVLLLTAPVGGDFAGLGATPADGGLPPGLRDGDPAGVVARCIAAVAAFDGVSLAALGGDAAGCGAELALACDLRVAARAARLEFPHVRHARMPACGATQRLPRLAGPGAAFRALVLGEALDGEEMLRLGLAAAVADSPAATIELAGELAARLAALPPAALRACREALLAAGDLPLREGLRLEADLATLLHTTDDRAEGLRAFLEKRPPHFTGT